MAIKQIIFDFANVLVKFKPKKYIEELFESEQERQTAYKVLFNSLEWLKLDRGVISPEKGLSDILNNTPLQMRERVEYLFNNWYKFMENIAETEELARDLKQNGYKLYLLSNIASSYAVYRDTIPALRYFDYEYLSYQHNLIKPDSRIYTAFIKEYGLNVQECYYIDDFHYNVDMAQSLGILSYLFDGDVKKLKEDMTKNGIRLTI